MISMHPRTWFPLILVTITMALLVVVLFLFGPAFVSNEASDVLPRVMVKEYQEQADNIVTGFTGTLEEAQTVQNDLLGLVVPADYREIHLEMVIATNLIIQGYSEADQDKIDQGLARFQIAVSQLE
tara:strand:+ start:298 stop:675 length:378 start_codon:yes stop_codon:yes gene_type:complete